MSCNCINIRRARKGTIFGVCAGLAKHYDLSVRWLRLGFILSVVLIPFGLPIVPILYIALAFMMKPGDPQVEAKRPAEEPEEYFDPRPEARSSNLRRLKERFDSIESRIRRMENHVTDKSYDWERRFRTNQ